MISAGIDVGAQNTKMVILDDDRLLSSRVLTGICDARKELRIAFEEILKEKTIGFNDLSGIGATGLGRQMVDFATASITESKCSARGAILAFPSTCTLIDIGAEQCQVMSCDEQGRVVQYVRNDGCAAGAGLFLEEMAVLLGAGVAEIGALSRLARREVNISNTCVIFAESEVISLVSDGYSREDIARAICEAIALRTLALLRTLEIKDDIVLIGGVALNPSVLDILQKKLGCRLLSPVDPLTVTAAGAACIARELYNVQ